MLENKNEGRKEPVQNEHFPDQIREQVQQMWWYKG